MIFLLYGTSSTGGALQIGAVRLSVCLVVPFRPICPERTIIETSNLAGTYSLRVLTDIAVFRQKDQTQRPHTDTGAGWIDAALCAVSLMAANPRAQCLSYITVHTPPKTLFSYINSETNQNSPSSAKVRPILSLSLFIILVHSADLHSTTTLDHQNTSSPTTWIHPAQLSTSRCKKGSRCMIMLM